MYSYSIYEALQNIEHEATGVFKDRPEGAGPEYGFWLLTGYVVEDNQLVLRVSVTPQVLENGSNIEPVSLRAYFRIWMSLMMTFRLSLSNSERQQSRLRRTCASMRSSA